MRNLLLTTLFCLLAFPLSAATVSEKSGLNAAVGAAPTTRDFVQQAAISDMFEIQSSQMASTMLGGKDKAFAERMIADHTKTSSQLADQAKADNIPLPTALDATHQAMLDKLRGLTDVSFRKQYLSDQLNAHQDAVSLFKRYAQGGDDAKLKSWAGKTLPILQHHLDMARALENSR